MDNRLTYHADGAMACPLCGDQWTHVEDVIMAGRGREDGPVTSTRIGPDGLIKSQTVRDSGAGRRHHITLIGNCETCRGHFFIDFTQHKGETELTAGEFKVPNDNRDEEFGEIFQMLDRVNETAAKLRQKHSEP